MEIIRIVRRLSLKIRSRHSPQLLVLILGLLFLTCSVFVWRIWFRFPPSVNQSFTNSDISSWQSFGGDWTASNEGIKNVSTEKGAKLVSGDLRWKDYEVDADVQLLSSAGDAGMTIRSSEEKRGVDSYDGYYVGLRPDPDNIFIGRADQGYFEYAMGKMPGGIHKLTWYHLHISAVGCEVTGIVSDPSSGDSARVSMNETSCASHGRIGLRSFIAGAIWKNVRVRSIQLNEMKRLRHILETFCSTIVLVLGCLVMYIRAEHWRLKAVLEERTRVAREIHDTLAQGFSAIALQLESVGREPGSHYEDNQNLDLAIEMARQSRKEAHVTIAALRNLSSDLSFATIIEKAAIRQLGSKQITLRVTSHVTMPRFPADVETQVFRIVQEAVANAAQHSGASKIAINFTFEDRTLIMTIKDDGSGLPLDKLPGLEDGHFGILGMKERASAINAICTIYSDNCGTSITVSVPLRNPHQFFPHLMSAYRRLILRLYSQKAMTWGG